MSEFESAIRGVSERFKPAIVFAARLAEAGEVPEEVRPEDPFRAWGAEHGAELLTAVEVAGSQRLTGENREELVTVLAGLRLAYMKVVSDLADQFEMPEGELHNLISEASNEARIDDRNEAGDDSDEGPDELPRR
ncbi:MAG: hypothetical protein AAF937_09080 [Planctomycetota bacterium]